MNTTAPTSTPQQRLQALENLIGNTPCLVLHCSIKGKHVQVFVKLESGNFTGSIKDRMALHIMRRAYELGAIKPGDTIVEATSGNTGIAFAGIGRALGHDVVIIMPDWMSKERTDVIKSMGAKVVPVSKEEGGFVGSIELSEKYATEHPDVFLPQQFANDANVEAHAYSTAPELLAQIEENGATLSAFVAGVGTGGTVMGVHRYFQQHAPEVKVHPLEPFDSPTLTTGHKVGSHRIQGISDEFIPEIVNLKELDAIVSVYDGDAICMAQRLATELGLPVGISSGANLLGALQLAYESDSDKVVATVFADCNKKYLSTDYVKEEAIGDDFLCPEIELHHFDVIKG
ncbi:MAG: PLP-dependent cysteine synthase family protein [Planctomycetota bacterium]|nr:PLP-dependent cysteine synthase family protein [Planctomycetota bacterium]